MARESRYDIYDIELEVPPPLVPRALVREVTERLDAGGAAVVPLDPADVRAAVRELAARGVEALAVCFLHAYRNPAHERAAAAVAADAAPGLPVSLSSDVMPDIREYERASTTVANAYVQPAIRRYLAELEESLRRRGIGGQLLVMTSDGGTLGCEAAARYPVRLVESGPAGGALAAAWLGRQAGVQDVMAFDMGGTTAKICLVDGGAPERTTDFEVARVYRLARGSGLPLRTPVLDMIEIGAGGGSIARVGALGLLAVGPESAGAAPGPAAYGLGGVEPTVTDADLALGYLDPDYFLGGEMRLDPGRAAAAIAERVARPLGLDPTRAAWGIHEVVNEHMARAAKVHCLERGRDPRRYTLVAFGGAGPVHAFRVARALGIRDVLFPARAGVMSAFGFLVAPPAFELLRACPARLDEADPALVGRWLGEMEAEGRALLAGARVDPGAVRVERELAIRYVGQSYELSVPLPRDRPGRATLARAGQRFLRRYRARYHRLNPTVPLELVRLRVVVRGAPPAVALARPRGAASAAAARKGRRRAFMPEAGGFVDCPVYDRAALPPGARLAGPAIVEERESTAVIGPGGVARVDAFQNLRVRVPPPGRPAPARRGPAARPGRPASRAAGGRG
jgi:N-methylhydantoinase A